MIWILPAFAWTPELPAWDDGSRLVAPPRVGWSTATGGEIGETAQLVVHAGRVGVGTGASNERTDGEAGFTVLKVNSGRQVGRTPFLEHPEVVRVTPLEEGWASFDSHSGWRRFTEKGELVWTTLLPGAAEIYACAPIVHGGEIFAQRSHLYAADPATGVPREVIDRRVFPPCSQVDVDGDGTTEWLHGSGHLRLMDAGGETRWALENEREGTQHHHVLGDLHPAQGPEVGLVTEASTLLIRSLQDGALLQEVFLGPLGGGRRRPVAASWFAEAGCFVSGGTRDDTSVVCANAEQVVWSRPVRGAAIYARPLIAELDGRPGDEVLIATRDGELLALDPAGRTVWAWRSEEPLVGTPLIGDFVGNANLEILVPGLHGQLTMLKTKGRGTPVLSGGPEDATWP